MRKCRAGKYTDNIVVTHGALVCHGGFGQPPCQYVMECMKEHGMRLRLDKIKNIKKKTSVCKARVV